MSSSARKEKRVELHPVHSDCSSDMCTRKSFNDELTCVVSFLVAIFQCLSVDILFHGSMLSIEDLWQ